MSKPISVRVGEACDGFSITLVYKTGEESRISFDQEESVARLCDVFEELGYDTEFYEDY